MKSKIKDYLFLLLAAGVLGGVLGVFIDPLTWLWWAIDIPILIGMNWWFLGRKPTEKNTTIRCASTFCKNEPQDDDNYCEVHRI